ncbi:uncharacterized protein METZ01_LOCUS210484 [marine metagenome]|uniref:Uncharacterized protein n=1 Tax=marine metagenome TaxID=408172 RepID=A0A382F3S4_9ZZZZ
MPDDDRGSLSLVYAQTELEPIGSSNMPLPIQRLIDLPTANTLAKGTAAMSLRASSASPADFSKAGAG